MSLALLNLVFLKIPFIEKNYKKFKMQTKVRNKKEKRTNAKWKYKRKGQKKE